jgi:hypothetical protein
MVVAGSVGRVRLVGGSVGGKVGRVRLVDGSVGKVTEPGARVVPGALVGLTAEVVPVVDGPTLVGCGTLNGGDFGPPGVWEPCPPPGDPGIDTPTHEAARDSCLWIGPGSDPVAPATPVTLSTATTTQAVTVLADFRRGRFRVFSTAKLGAPSAERTAASRAATTSLSPASSSRVPGA